MGGFFSKLWDKLTLGKYRRVLQLVIIVSAAVTTASLAANAAQLYQNSQIRKDLNRIAEHVGVDVETLRQEEEESRRIRNEARKASEGGTLRGSGF
jgi:hypothetical protein